MPEINNSLAASIAPPAGVDPFKALGTLSQIQLAQSHGSLYKLQAEQEARKLAGFDVLKSTGDAAKAVEAGLDPAVAAQWQELGQKGKGYAALSQHGAAAAGGDRGAAAAISAVDPEAAGKIATMRSTMTETDKKAFDHSYDTIGRIADTVMKMPQEQRGLAYQQLLTDAARSNAIKPEQYQAAIKMAPTDQNLQMGARLALTVKQARETYGEEERAKEANKVVQIAPGATAIPGSRVFGDTPSPIKAVPGGSSIPGETIIGYGMDQPGAKPPQMAQLAPGVNQMPGGGVSNTNSAPMINLNMGNTPKYLEETGAEIARMNAEKQKSIPGHVDTLKAIGELRTSLEGLPTGPGTMRANDISSVLSRFGVDINKVTPTGWQTDPSKASVAQKNMTQLAVAYAKGNFPTRITDSDIQVATSATPNLWNRPDANSVLLKNLEDVTKIKMEEAKFWRQETAKFSQDNPPTWQIMDKWTDHLAGMKNVPDSVKQSYMADKGISAKLEDRFVFPQGAIQAAHKEGAPNELIYQFKKPGGTGYFWGNKDGTPLK